MLSLGFVTGVEPDKWLRRFREYTTHGGVDAHGLDDPLAPVLAGELDLALIRLPDSRIDDSLHLIELYDESVGIAVPRDSVFAEAGESLTPRDVEGEIVNYRTAADGSVDIAELRAALQVVAANVGIAVAPRPAIKVLSKKQVVHLAYTDPTVVPTRIALAFLRDSDSDAIQDFIGVAKGRGANSSRQAAPKRSAREKSLAKQERRAASGKKPQAPRRGRRIRRER